MTNFCHLHLHTQYSVLDGANKPAKLIARAAQFGQKAVAMTDHGNMHGAIEFYNLAKSAGIKPIIGCEVYLCSGSRSDRTPKAQGGPSTYHLTLLASNLQGYRNLSKLVTLAYLEGFYFKPRIDHELLAELNEGLVCLSGCVSGEFGAFARAGDQAGARAVAEKYLRIFGDRYYLEVMPHRMTEQQILNQVAKSVGQELGVPLVATNDCHYLDADDAHAQEVLMCIGTGKVMADETRLRHDNLSLHFKSEKEMLEEMPDFQEAVLRSSEIVDRCELEFDCDTYHMPQFPAPASESLESLFRRTAEEGLAERLESYRERNIPFDEKVYRDRLELEMGVIIEMGFVGYFLVVSDFILWAKRNDIPVGPGRGSAAGALVAYVMFITEIDPIANNLLFERFLNPERVSMPDIDVDFCIFGREKVIEYVSEKYGKDKVAQIATFGTLKAKAVIKDVGRVLGMSFSETDRIAKLVPAPRQGFDYPLEEALQMEKRLKEYAEGEGKELISLALKLEGLSRHTSTHAAGVVIADKPIVEYMPLMVDKEGQVVSQFSMGYVEKIGLVKFDFLGLKTLTVLHRALHLIKENLGKVVDLNKLPLNDPKVFNLICRGRTIGVFQMESGGITEMVCRLKPNCFEDIVAILALYRPGPLEANMVDHYINRKHGREKVVYPHPLTEPILKDTYGIILYQEQIMQIARDLAGYTLGGADILRKAMGKKKLEEMAKQRETFVQGARKKGVAEKVAEDVFDQIETFGRYGFNRSHSVAYALISYQTAYLKAHFPVQFMAGLMTYEKTDTDKTLKNLNECEELGIEVLPPDLNQGGIGFSVTKKKIVFDLSAIKGIGEKVVEKILEERNKNGQFKHLLDFCRRMDSSALNKRAMEGFICSGAFDWTGLTRAELLTRFPDVEKLVESEKKEASSNQMSLFAAANAVQVDKDEDYRPSRELVKEWATSTKLSKEKESLGFYLSGHPLVQFKDDLINLGCLSSEQFQQASSGAEVKVGGVITFLKEKNTKKGDRYATFVLEDQLGTVETVVWPEVYKRTFQILASEDPVLVTGKVDVSEERRVLIANDVSSVVELRCEKAKEVCLQISAERCSPEVMERLRILLRENSGACPVKILIQTKARSEVVLALPSDIKVAPSETLRNRLEEIFGEHVMLCR